MKALFLFFILTINAYALNPGDMAPDFKLKNQEGKDITLKDLKGQFIVLEWFNHGCPYVRKHYDSQNMQTMQKLYKANKDVTWVTVSSSAKGKQGYISSPEVAKSLMAKELSAADHLLLDSNGIMGKAYGAQATPYFVLINHDGKVAYVGAIDSIATADKADIKKAKNYITSGMSKILLAQKPNPQKTKAYGCSVKY